MSNTLSDLDTEISFLLPYKEDNSLVAGLANAYPEKSEAILSSISDYHKKISKAIDPEKKGFLVTNLLNSFGGENKNCVPFVKGLKQG